MVIGGTILLMAIGGFSISNYCWLFFCWPLVVIFSVAIDGYSIDGYYWLFVNGYWWLL